MRMAHITIGQHTKKFIWLLFMGVVLLLICSPEVAAAQNKYIPLTGIPGVTPGSTNLPGLLNALYILAISLGALFAVIKIAIAGVKYSTSGDNASARSSAKNDIYGALFGLAILLATYIVLNQINPSLTSLNILGNAKPAVLTNTSNPSGTSGATTPTSGGPAAPNPDASVSWTSNQTCYTDSCKAACTGPNKKLVPYPSGAAVCQTTTTYTGSTESGNTDATGQNSGFETYSP